MPGSSTDGGRISYQSTEQHPELMNEINDSIDITF